MGVFDGIVEEIKTVLAEDPTLSDIHFVNAHRIDAKPSPIKDIYVTLGLSGVETSSGAFGDYFGRKNGNDLFGKSGRVSISCKIHCPQTMDGSSCSEVFSRICNSLMLDDSMHQIESIICKGVSFENKSGAFVLDCTIKLRVFIGSTVDETEVSDIVVKEIM